MRRFLLVLFALSFITATPAFAQNDPFDDDADETDPNIRYKAETEIDFREQHVGGGLKGPGIGEITERPGSVFNPLIRLKTDFTAEMIESANQIR